MDNKTIAEILEETAELLEVKSANPFRIRAYYNGARAVAGLTQDINELVKAGTLTEIQGIGAGLAGLITEIVKTGKSKDHEQLKKEFPAGFLELLRVPGLGPSRAKVLFSKLKIKNIEDLKNACKNNKLLKLPKFGDKSQAKILEACEQYGKTKGLFLISDALEESRNYLSFLKKSKDISQLEVAGSVRRHKEIVHDIDFIATSKNPKKVHQHFLSYGRVHQVLAQGETKSSVMLKSGLQIDLRTVKDSEFPYALYYSTGSQEHNVAIRTIAKRMGLKVNEYGIFKGKKLIPCKDEADIFKIFGMDYVVPEIRENMGEIEAAKNKKLPKLIEAKHIKGIFHVHSTYSDGVASLEDMIRGAEKLGYDYVGISDHSKTATYANGLSEKRLDQQNKELDKLEKKFKIRIFRGIESDILGDGTLDYSDKILKKFDFVIGSIHSRFNMQEKEMTERIMRAMEHPAMTILGHPTGRLLLRRKGYTFNFDAIFKQAKKYGVVLELNSDPHRLDLDWRVLKEAKNKGLTFSINPDAHSVYGLSYVDYGIGIARKGWLEKEDVLNTMNVSEIESYLTKRKK